MNTSAASKASARRRGRSTSRSFPAMSRSTTRRRAQAYPRRPRSGASVWSRTWRETASLAFKAPGEDIWLIGGAPGWLGQSAWLATVAGREEGAPPPVDLIAERRNGEFVASLIRAKTVSAVHDLLRRRPRGWRWPRWRWRGELARGVEAQGARHAFFFGEDQGRYILTCARRARTAAIADQAKRHNVPLLRIAASLEARH